MKGYEERHLVLAGSIKESLRLHLACLVNAVLVNVCQFM